MTRMSWSDRFCSTTISLCTALLLSSIHHKLNSLEQGFCFTRAYGIALRITWIQEKKDLPLRGSMPV